MVGYHLADLSLPPNRIFVGDGDLTAEKLEWAQPADMWTLVYYEHTNAVTQQNSTALVSFSLSSSRRSASSSSPKT